MYTVLFNTTLWWLICIHCCCHHHSPVTTTALSSSDRLSHKSLRRSYLFPNKPPYALTVANILDVDTDENFLATQVWPAARAASLAEQQLLCQQQQHLIVCEFGCGPGLPSLTAAASGATAVVATDVDPVALQLVHAAAAAQQWQVEVQAFDLLHWYADAIPHADVYILSDVFENADVAEGAARVSAEIVGRGRGASVWVFAQSDRAQREIYLSALAEVCSGQLVGLGTCRFHAIGTHQGNNRAKVW